MKFELRSRRQFGFPLFASLCLIFLSLPAIAHEPERTIPDPGYRPECEHAQMFLEMLDTATVAVLPSLIRRAERTAHSFDSQQLIVTLLNDAAIVSAVPKPKRIKLAPLRRPSQWEMFEYGMETVSHALQRYDTETDFTVVMEFIIPDGQEIFGIEIYILNKQGENAFSFLLNAHHEIFAEAKLRARNSTEDARGAMIMKATTTAIEALRLQIDAARADASLEDNVTGF